MNHSESIADIALNASVRSHVHAANYSSTYAKAWFSVTCGISLVGVLCYPVLLVTILSARRLRRGVGVLIVYQIFADCAVLCTLFTRVNDTGFGSYLHASINYKCVAYYFCSAMFIISGNWNSFFLACNRVVALFFPHHFSTLTTGRVTGTTIFISYLVGLGLCLIGALGSKPILGHVAGDCGVKEVQNVRFVALFSSG